MTDHFEGSSYFGSNADIVYIKKKINLNQLLFYGIRILRILGWYLEKVVLFLHFSINSDY